MEKKRSLPNRFVQWVRDARAELRRVVWPTPKETRNLTLIVLGLSAAVGAIMWAFDSVFAKLYELLASVI